MARRTFADHCAAEPQEAPTLRVEPAAAAAWLEDVYSLVDAGDPDGAIDVLFDHFDALLMAGEYPRCSDLLLAIDPKRLDTNVLVSALAITKPAASRLPERPRFLRRVEERLRVLAPERVEGLLNGLR